ncbi:MAG: family 43 glycosylhydrolase [Spirosomataceae bacterium]
MRIVVLVLCWLFCLASSWAQIPQEQGGFVEVEAEDFIAQSLNEKRSWSRITNQTPDNHTLGAGKNSYIECLPDTRTTHNDKLIAGENFSNKAGEMAVVSYKVHFSTTGRFYVWVRAYSTGTEDNGVHVGIDDTWPASGQRMQWCDGKKTWRWESKQRTEKNHCGEPFNIYLDIEKPGEHLIQFSMREDGFEIDKFLLTTDQNFNPNNTLKRAQIYIRDPFIFADESTKTYFMFSSANKSEYLPEAVNGVVVYQSKDLENWLKPIYVFKTPKNMWASDQHGVWAPEVHAYQGKYYLFATFTNPEKSLTAINSNAKTAVRGTAILVADSLNGIYKPLTNHSITPTNWMALDGTLFIENGKPYLVFCHEWIQVVDGTMERMALSKDLSSPKSKPKTMFKASDAPWAKKLENVKSWNTSGYITDGPWFYRTKGGKLLMLWSSFGTSGYSVGLAESSDGKLTGKWTQKERLFEKDGGHAMVFKTFDGQLILTLHQPNSGDIRARFLK